MTNGVFMGEVNSFITAMTNDTSVVKSNSILWSDGKDDGPTWTATLHAAIALKLVRLNKVIGIQGYNADIENNSNKIWAGK